MKRVLFFATFFFTLFANAQQVQWASKLIKYSSDLGGKQNGIKRILGKPDVFPQAGSSPNAWTPKQALDGREIVIVGFEKAQDVKQIAIFENLNAGCVVKLSVDTGSGSYQSVWVRRPDYKTPIYKTTLSTDRSYYFKKKRRKVYEIPDVFNPGIEHVILDKMYQNVVAVKVEFNFAQIPGEKQIDAIGISNSEIPIEAQINTDSKFENLPNSNDVFQNENNFISVLISNEGNKMYLTNSENEIESVYSSQKINENWNIPILENILNDNESFNYVVNAQNEILVKGGASYNRGSGETGYYFYTNENQKYKKSEPLKITAFSNYGETSDACFSKDNKMLLLGIESDFSQGGKDLYVSNKKEDGTFGMLQNLGKIINSASDEITPHLLSDSKTLLFASDGFSGFGSYDIFVSYRLDDSWKNWSEPINIGSKMNGNGLESSPFYDEVSKILYFISSENGKSIVKSIKMDLLSK